MRNCLALTTITLALLSACGGGGGGTTTTNPPPPPPTQVIASPGQPNVEALIVDAGPSQLTAGQINTAYMTVTVCIPGSTPGSAGCQSIDHVEIDTGSVGLRIIAGPPSSQAGGELSLNLPMATLAGNPLAECLQFADGDTWGSVRTADIYLTTSGEMAAGVSIQVIGDPAAGDPSKASPSCVPMPPLSTENTVTSFGANGIFGVGPFIDDCNSTGPCPLTQPSQSAIYYGCPANGTCTATGSVQVAQQLPNPVTKFAKHADGSVDNNGVIVELPPVAAGGVDSIESGASVVFGIGTQSNNALGGATQLTADPVSGFISATLNGSTLSESFLDSGSNGDFFNDSSIAICPTPNQGFYCPTSDVSESATLQGMNGATLAADFTVSMLPPVGIAAAPGVAGPNVGPIASSSLDLGLPFFYGRNVYTGFEDVMSGSGPYFAY